MGSSEVNKSRVEWLKNKWVMPGPQGTGPTNTSSWLSCLEGTQGPLSHLWHFPKLAPVVWPRLSHLL